MFNKKDMPEIEDKLKKLIDTDGTFKEPCAEKYLKDVTGPSSGLVYEYDEQRLHLADGWTFDADGNIVQADDITGPSAGARK